MEKDVRDSGKEEVRRGVPWTKSRGFQLIVALIWLALIAACLLHKDDISVAGILNGTPSNPWLAAAWMLLLFALKSVSIVVYSGLLYAVSGILFPLPAAILVNLCGTVVMVSVPYWIGRKTGASVVEHVRQKYPKSRHFQTLRKKNDFVFSYLVRIFHMPGDVVSLYMGAIQVNYAKYLAGSFLGILPHAVLYSIMGVNITDVHSPEFKISLCMELAYLVLTAVFYTIYSRRQRDG